MQSESEMQHIVPTETDTVPLPRHIARQMVVMILGDISEEDWAAGWMDGAEDGVWARLAGHDRGRNWPATDDYRETLLVLASGLGEWPAPESRGRGWVPLSLMAQRWGALPS